ncbi:MULTISPECIES: NAD(P)-dependent oxidoreductase [unclassified Ruminococcus]|uniref:NAD(P)-dependent oxidoreductase n=1 Tax=unclassified Ruminococcus TaxID=2608920 RepID=UPI00210E47D8|nr:MULTISPECIES: NAD(P)-dependent oxidoreductase [unclassified Ruminococcus]MCQ4023116.1 NAD(P)-dependent oxidoreductase [Ruminococcus sp. zg-924]MCQ4115113.1 NAD(P)-dependent oxidoreductase [Ruminococcus sp. zg-921]
MDIIVGYTGFVGSNIAAEHTFDYYFNSKNIQDAFGLNPDLCVYSGVRAEKFLANNDPDGDMAIINNAIDNIKKINPKRLVLISTIDVYKNPNGADEDVLIDTDNLHPYGLNRYRLEQWVSENIENYHIIRLPGLFGKNIKKNFIFDLINIIPSMLNEKKYSELSAKSELIRCCYKKQDNGFYKFCDSSQCTKSALKQEFLSIGFSALNFTDSRGVYQFYNLSRLWEHIEIVIKNDVRLVNMAVEPVCTADIYRRITGKEFVNEVAQTPPLYDFKTKHYSLFGGKDGYIFDKNQVSCDIENFVKSQLNEA